MIILNGVKRMKKKAIISILSKQFAEEEDTIEVVTPGDFYKEDDCYYATYKETEISGMEGTTTTLKIYPEKFSLNRFGTTNANMDFKRNSENITLYNTPYGVLELKIKTKELDVNINDEGGEVFVYYNMSVSGQKPQNTVLKINIKAQ